MRQNKVVLFVYAKNFRSKDLVNEEPFVYRGVHYGYHSKAYTGFNLFSKSTIFFDN